MSVDFDPRVAALRYAAAAAERAKAEDDLTAGNGLNALVCGLVYVGDQVARLVDIARPVGIRVNEPRESAEIRSILREKVVGEDGPCNFDHHGQCQEHGWFGAPGECGVRRARVLLGIDREEGGDGGE